MTHPTETLGSDVRAASRGAGWTLAVALDCERLLAAPVRISLDGVTEVELGRGAARAVQRNDASLRVDLPDRWTSQIHARMTRGDDGWLLQDADSKNGVRVNGRLIERATLADGDVVECGCTFFVIRRSGKDVDRRAATPHEALPPTLSPALERELAPLAKIARSRVSVIIRGESGTGKEVMAAALHALSGRSGPLVAVNCGAIPATLVESTLFGSRKGAFSGAEDSTGLVRGAHEGTMFLDEVAELPLSSQAALLRVLDEGAVLPLGASKTVTVDVRVLAATHRPMEELVAAERFRGDLYARLRGYTIVLPPRTWGC